MSFVFLNGLELDHVILLVFWLQSALPPQQLAWCGMDSVLLYWDDMLLMMGPDGDPVRYFYDEPVVLIPECDGVRILSNTSMEFLQRVPDSTVTIFRIGSTSPAALLYDALDHFDRRSAKVILFFPFLVETSSINQALEESLSSEIFAEDSLLAGSNQNIIF